MRGPSPADFCKIATIADSLGVDGVSRRKLDVNSCKGARGGKGRGHPAILQGCPNGSQKATRSHRCIKFVEFVRSNAKCVIGPRDQYLQRKYAARISSTVRANQLDPVQRTAATPKSFGDARARIVNAPPSRTCPDRIGRPRTGMPCKSLQKSSIEVAPFGKRWL